MWLQNPSFQLLFFYSLLHSDFHFNSLPPQLLTKSRKKTPVQSFLHRSRRHTLSDGCKAFFQIGNDIVYMLRTDRQANRIRLDSLIQKLFGRKL